MSRKGWIYIALVVFMVATAIGFIAGGMAIKEDEASPQDEVEKPSYSSNSKTGLDDWDDGVDDEEPIAEEPLKALETEVRYLAQGTAWQTELYIIRGAIAGPKMLVLGGVHGDERAAFPAGDAASELRLERGTLYVIPRFNKVAFANNSRVGTGDINRKFPGDMNSNDVETRLCGEVSELIRQEGIKMVLTFHEALGFRSDGHPGQTFYYDWDSNPYVNPPTALTAKAQNIFDIVNKRIRSCPQFSFQEEELYKAYVDPIAGSATYEMMRVLGVDYAYGCETARINDPRKRVWFHLNALTSWMELEGFVILNWSEVESRIWSGGFPVTLLDSAAFSTAAA